MAMDLFHVKQLFTLGAFRAVVQAPTPSDPFEVEAVQLYKVRSLIALGELGEVAKLMPGESLTHRAARAFARDDFEALRDLCVEIEEEGETSEKDAVRILAGTAFVRAGELEEALETLTPSTELEAVAIAAHVYLSISRPDLARKALEVGVASRQSDDLYSADEMLEQRIAASIALRTGADSYNDPSSFYAEQLANRNLSGADGARNTLLAARGTTYLLRGELREATVDFREVAGSNGDALANSITATLLSKRGDSAELFAFVLRILLLPASDELCRRLQQDYPTHPIVADCAEKSAAFDAALVEFTVPPLAVA